MNNLNDIYNNPLSRRWKKRYNELPNDVKERLNELSNQKIVQYQLDVIKRKRIIPQKGDVFLVNPKESLYFFGVVVNDNVNNINGDGLYVAMIFRNKAESLIDTNFVADYKNLLIAPSIIGKEYWTKGYFYNIELKAETFQDIEYGFYSIAQEKYLNEYGKEVFKVPHLFGNFGVKTISGIAYQINKELIIDNSLHAK